LRGMPAKERNAYVSKRRENMDPNLALAIVEMPAELSGVLESDRNNLLDRALHAQHGDAMKELQELERAIEVAESAGETGRDEVRQETGLNAKVFDERAAPIEAKSKSRTPWLRHMTIEGVEQIGVVDLDRKVWRPATPEEIASGVFFRDFDEYQAANPNHTAQAAA